MSAELDGAVIGNVYPRSENTVGGYSQEQFEWLQAQVAADLPYAGELRDALESLKGQNPGQGIKALRKAGKIVLAACNDESSPVGLLYAEEDPSFTMVNIGTWVLPKGIETPEGFRFYNNTLRREVREDLVSVALNQNEEDGDPLLGLPVKRLTTIVPLWDQDGEGLHEYVYGQEQDIKAVSALDIPFGLKETLLTRTAQWHEAERVIAESLVVNQRLQSGVPD